MIDEQLLSLPLPIILDCTSSSLITHLLTVFKLTFALGYLSFVLRDDSLLLLYCQFADYKPLIIMMMTTTRTMMKWWWWWWLLLCCLWRRRYRRLKDIETKKERCAVTRTASETTTCVSCVDKMFFSANFIYNRVTHYLEGLRGLVSTSFQ